MGYEVEGLKVEQKHGTTKVRVGRVWRREDGTNLFVEWNVSISLVSDCLSAYVSGDNSNLISSDTLKNNVYVKAKECLDLVSMEEFAVELGRQLTSSYPPVTAAMIKIVETPWKRVFSDGQPHDHGFQLGSEKSTTEVTVKKSGALRITSGIEGLGLLKTTKSGFDGFVQDNYTILQGTKERISAIHLNASWRYAYESLASIRLRPISFRERNLEVNKALVDTFFGPPKEGVYSPSIQNTLYRMARAVLNKFPDLESIQLCVPALNFVPVSLRNKDNASIVKFEDDVYAPVEEPLGTIKARLRRSWSKF